MKITRTRKVITLEEGDVFQDESIEISSKNGRLTINEKKYYVFEYNNILFLPMQRSERENNLSIPDTCT